MSRRSTFKETLDYFRELEVSKFWIVVLLVIAFFVGRDIGLSQRRAALYTGYLGGYCEGQLDAAWAANTDDDYFWSEDAYAEVGMKFVDIGEGYFNLEDLPYPPYRQERLEPMKPGDRLDYLDRSKGVSTYIELGKIACGRGMTLRSGVDRTDSDIIESWKW